MNRKEYLAVVREENKAPRQQVNIGDEVFVLAGKMAGTRAKALSVDDKYVYMRHNVTNIEFRCLINDIKVVRL